MANPKSNTDKKAAYKGWRTYLNAPVMQSLLPLSAAGNDLTLQTMMASVIRHETKNTEFKRDWLFDRGGRSICLLTQMAMKRSTRLINNPTGPMPKILLKFVGFFSIFGVSRFSYISHSSENGIICNYIESAGLFCDSLAAFTNALKYSASPVLNNPYHASNSGGA